jgi:integrase
MLAADKRRDPNGQPALHLPGLYPAPIDEPTADAWPVALASDSSWTTFPPAISALRAYQRARDQAVPEPEAATFLVNRRGRPLDGHSLPHAFARLVAAAGIQAPPGRRAPRLHDLRHAFTVATMLDCYRDGANVQARLPLLSAWLGHVDPTSTYWYLQAVPELLTLAAGRLEPSGREGQQAP